MNRVRNIIGLEQSSTTVPTGKGITICILDSGIAVHPDFGNRILAFRDFIHGETKMYDDYGHGTHIAGICGGNGMLAKGKYAGIATECNLVVGKILNRQGDGRIDDLVAGIRWCIELQKTLAIRLLNISVGLLTSIDSRQQELLLKYIDEAWNHGIVTVCAAGNNGPGMGTVTVPGTQPKVITVGSVEKGRHGIYVSKYSGRGPTSECVLKPEIYAPGTDIISCSHQGGYTKKTGTSMAVPVVTGALALLLQEQPRLSPVDVKLKLYETAKPLADDKHRSWGMLYVSELLADSRN